MSNKIICLSVLLIFFASCMRHSGTLQSKISAKSPVFKSKQLPTMAVEEAKLSDIAIHPHAEHIPMLFYKNDSTIMLGYQHNSGSIANIARWYVEHMEQLGWHCKWSIEGFERMYIFEKPTKQCMISLRPFNKKCRAVIYFFGVDSDQELSVY